MAELLLLVVGLLQHASNCKVSGGAGGNGASPPPAPRSTAVHQQAVAGLGTWDKRVDTAGPSANMKHETDDDTML